MKKIMTLTIALMTCVALSAMSYSEARDEALYLTDKMASELGLDNEQYDAVYRINLDYLLALDDRESVSDSWVARRNAALSAVLIARQFENFIRCTYFHRPRVIVRPAPRVVVHPAPRVVVRPAPRVVAAPTHHAGAGHHSAPRVTVSHSRTPHVSASPRGQQAHHTQRPSSPQSRSSGAQVGGHSSHHRPSGGVRASR